MAKSLKTFWLACEKLASAGVMKEWDRQIRDPDILAAARKLLVPTAHQAQSYPCTNEHWCACSHEVITHRGESMVAICTCEDGECDPIPVSKEDLIVYEMNHARILGGAARAAGLALIEPVCVDIHEPVHFADLDAGGNLIPAYFAMTGCGCLNREHFISLLIGSHDPFILFTTSPFDFHISGYRREHTQLHICLADLMLVSDEGKLGFRPELRAAVEQFGSKAVRAIAANKVMHATPSEVPSASVFRQTDGFHNIWLHGKKLPTLSDMQADMVRVLYEALCSGETDLRFAAIASRMKEPPGRFDNVFRADDERRCVIRSVKRGVFQLNI